MLWLKISNTFWINSNQNWEDILIRVFNTVVGHKAIFKVSNISKIQREEAYTAMLKSFLFSFHRSDHTKIYRLVILCMYKHICTFWQLQLLFRLVDIESFWCYHELQCASQYISSIVLSIGSTFIFKMFMMLCSTTTYF